jgi:hypothetical protein
VSESQNGKRKMLRVLSWQDEIQVIAGPKLSGDTKESWLARAARKAGITFRQCKALYYNETKDPKASVASSVLLASRQAREEAKSLASQFETLAGAMNAADEDFYSPDVLALIDAARVLRGLDRA